ncbi:acetate/propionate family kinase [Roseovarius faecimaris]|uniref:Acetate kinase n=1 Tax=Roseovarius faecimaris TaxID=2494550 RepID=A0A6I6ILW3_9RHOB|nr:acetate/propionate family kinase [Roseovarius faecimaris]QGX97064.1 acetate/propionate family kinase [Roseovarius faecimaris]
MILVINAGSSSIKFAVFDAQLVEQIDGMAEGIGSSPRLKIAGQAQSAAFADHDGALRAILDALAEQGWPLERFDAAAHRVVHGGVEISRPVAVTPEVIEVIEACAELAPLHNPNNLAGIQTLQRLAPDLPQFASFDTAFHGTNPEVAQRYAIPEVPETRGIRRYGFHGQSYAWIVRHLPQMTDAALPARLLAFHLGNGASICAIRDGVSVATSMGYSPTEGLTMGTRSGTIDPKAVIDLVDRFGETKRAFGFLNDESGLKGLSGGISDMRALLASDAPEAAFAVEHFCYWARRHAGSLIAAMEGCDGVVFTGGIGENAAQVRARILSGLTWLGLALDHEANARNAPRLHATGSAVRVWIVKAEEERMIAADALSLLGAAAKKM